MSDLKSKYQLLSDSILLSLQEDELMEHEQYEWYGYLQGVRDCAYGANFLSETTIQENLEAALEIISKKPTKQ
jgi:hypothetical protein